jgi:hypothetical protein
MHGLRWWSCYQPAATQAIAGLASMICMSRTPDPRSAPIILLCQSTILKEWLERGVTALSRRSADRWLAGGVSEKSVAASIARQGLVARRRSGGRT